MSFQRIVLLLMAGAMPVFGSSHSYANCFDRTSRRAISNYLPLAQYHMVSVATCMHHCIMAAGNGPMGGSICKSFTYNIVRHSCQIYDHDGYKVPAVLHPAIGVDIFVRNSEDEQCEGPILNNKDGSNSNFVVLNSGNKQYKKNFDMAIPKKKVQKQQQGFRTHDVPSTRDTFAMKLTDDSPLIKIDSEMKVPQDDRDLMESSPKRKVIKSVIKDDNEVCETSTAYYVVLGTEIEKGAETEGLIQELNDIEQGDCAKLCSSNVGLNQKSFICKSLNYYPLERKCELYSIQVEPNGPGKFLANPNTIYSEKFCVPRTNQVCQEDEVFILHVQKDVKGVRVGEKKAHGITPCLQMCLATDNCKSAVYKDGPGMCYLYASDLAAHPRDLVDTEPGAVAIENSCSPRARTRGTKTFNSYKTPKKTQHQTEEKQEEEWSACRFKIDGRPVKVRIGGRGELEVRRC